MSTATSTQQVRVPGEQSMVALLGPGDELLRLAEEQFEADVHVRGNEITISGQSEQVESSAKLFRELVELLGRGQQIDRQTVRQTARMVRDGGPERASHVLSEALLTHRGRTIRAKSLGQKRYLDAIRANTVTFGIGPAGTGKTYLAMAAAVQALRAKQVNRLLLTRPAVEAGERLGFLPGTLHEKIDPYLKPLWDALHDMMEADEMYGLLDRGTIEVAPLAFMRGRAQPVDSQVMTPDGWRAIGDLHVGDDVIGADGTATRVTGVFPQGSKEVYRLTAQDGATTRCCAEHLWSVWTRSDRRRGKPPRTLETQEMIGNLRAAHSRRYELPVAGPVQMPARYTPMDPYVLGLLLGDGTITGRTTPGFTTTDPELVDAIETAIPWVELRPTGRATDYRIVGRGHSRGGVITENPVTAVLRDLELEGTTSSTKFVPDIYLRNDVVTRHHLLQGLLDSDGGPVQQRGRTCRIQYSTTSPRLRDDVVHLVRSLGGVAYSRTRAADGRPPGRAGGRSVHHRNDAHVVDIRLPAGIAPFRLQRKAAAYDADGGGRPMRFIDSIEPDGRAATVCISVAAEDSLYVTDDFLVTHNTLNDSFVILDEAQNTTAEQMKMFLTRIGFGSKAVVTGDVSQVDLPGGRRSGLKVVRTILDDIEGVEFAYLQSGDVVRHHIVQRIVEAYEAHDSAGRDERSGRGRES